MARKSPTLKIVIIIALLSLVIAITLLTFKSFKQPAPFVAPDQLYLAQAPGSYANAIKKSAPGVVNIQTIKATKSQQGLGSGVIVDADGHILTNYHVVKDTKAITVKLADGRKTTAQIIGTDPQTDLAVLQIKFANLPVTNLGDSSRIQVGDVALAIGNPLGLNNTVTQGIISSIGAIDYGEVLTDLIQTDAAINLGSSGGALIDAYGNIIGINTAIVSNLAGSQGIGFAIPSNTAKKIMQELIAHGKVIRGWLGAQLSELPDETRQYLKFQQANGIYVQNTIRNSPAQKAGILPGDIITKINNAETLDITSSVKLISSLTPDKTYPLEIFRHGKRLVYTVAITERP